MIKRGVMKDQAWFKMADVKATTLGDGEWTPLWAYDVVEAGDSMSSPHQKEVLI